MTLAEFSNALRILHSIDWPDAKGIMSGEAYDYDYRRDPVRYFLRADDATQAKLWAIIEARRPKRDAA